MAKYPNTSLSSSHIQSRKAINVIFESNGYKSIATDTFVSRANCAKHAKTHHHLLKEVNDLLLREVHGSVVEEGLRDGQFGLGGERVSWVLDEGLFLLHARFSETRNAVTLKENTSV